MIGGRIAAALWIMAVTTGGFWGRGMAEDDCGSAVYDLQPCRLFFETIATSPSQECCSALGDAVRSKPRCICLFLRDTVGLGGALTLILSPLDYCNLHTGSRQLCNGEFPSVDGDGLHLKFDFGGVIISDGIRVSGTAPPPPSSLVGNGNKTTSPPRFDTAGGSCKRMMWGFIFGPLLAALL